jgi:hypothetical protein
MTTYIFSKLVLLTKRQKKLKYLNETMENKNQQINQI